MNIYFIGMCIGVLIGLSIAALYCFFLLLMKSDEDWINDWRKP